MKLLEYEAKQILDQSGVQIPAPHTILQQDDSFANLPLPAVVKSQVPIGGRGKAGGIKIAKTREELTEKIQDIFALPIGGLLPKSILCESLLQIDRELYILLTINRSAKIIELIAHPNGGTEIESHESDEFFKRQLSPATNFDALGDELADYYNLPEKAFLLGELVEKLYRCFITNDATLLEINPLVLTQDGALVAGDCKMTLDGGARFRHPEWSFEEESTSANFVALNPNGSIASIANGAGLAMATVDAIAARGYLPANFLDIGGSATHENILAAIHSLAALPNVHTIVVNIFGGIVQCDTVAQAIIDARTTTKTFPQLLIRLNGNRSDEAAALLAKHGLSLFPDLASCLKELQS